MTREDNLQALITSIDFEIEITTPLGPWPVRVEDGGEGNRLQEVRGIARRRLNAMMRDTEANSSQPHPPTDFNARVLLGDGSPVPDDESHKEIQPNGQQKDYVVLSPEERNRGFVRPYRDAYRHEKCGHITTMNRAIAETYAREPHFYTGTFCSTCRNHFPVGADGEFHWYEMNGTEGPKVGM